MSETLRPKLSSRSQAHKKSIYNDSRLRPESYHAFPSGFRLKLLCSNYVYDWTRLAFLFVLPLAMLGSDIHSQELNELGSDFYCSFPF
jgi:hypothetical protein